MQVRTYFVETAAESEDKALRIVESDKDPDEEPANGASNSGPQYGSGGARVVPEWCRALSNCFLGR